MQNGDVLELRSENVIVSFQLDSACIVSGMQDLDEVQVLVTAVGEYTLSTLGAANLAGLRVTLDPNEMSAHITVALRDNSDSNQKSVIADLLEVEQLYFDELVMGFSLVNSLADEETPRASVPQYSFA